MIIVDVIASCAFVATFLMKSEPCAPVRNSENKTAWELIIIYILRLQQHFEIVLGCLYTNVQADANSVQHTIVHPSICDSGYVDTGPAEYFSGQILGRLNSRPKKGRLGIAFTRGRSVKFMKCAKYELCQIYFSFNQKSLET